MCVCVCVSAIVLRGRTNKKRKNVLMDIFSASELCVLGLVRNVFISQVLGTILYPGTMLLLNALHTKMRLYFSK